MIAGEVSPHVAARMLESLSRGIEGVEEDLAKLKIDLDDAEREHDDVRAADLVQHALEALEGVANRARYVAEHLERLPTAPMPARRRKAVRR